MKNNDQKDWKKRYESLKPEVERLIAKLDAAMNINVTLEAEKRQWVKEQIKQQEIIIKQLGNSDNIVNQLQDEIRSIKSKICEDCNKLVR